MTSSGTSPRRQTGGCVSSELAVDLERCGHSCAELDKAIVEERDANLERVRHRGAVEVVEHVVDEVELTVEHERALDAGAPGSVELRGERPRSTSGATFLRAPRGGGVTGRFGPLGAGCDRSRHRVVGGGDRRRARDLRGPRCAIRPRGAARDRGAAQNDRAEPPAVAVVSGEKLVGSLAGSATVTCREVSLASAEKPTEDRSAIGSSSDQMSVSKSTASSSESSSSWCSAPRACAVARATASSLSGAPVKPTEEGLDRLRHVASHQGGHEARVEAAAQHRPERHVASSAASAPRRPAARAVPLPIRASTAHDRIRPPDSASTARRAPGEARPPGGARAGGLLTWRSSVRGPGTKPRESSRSTASTSISVGTSPLASTGLSSDPKMRTSSSTA